MDSINAYLTSPAGQRLLTSALCVLLGALATWLVGKWRRYRQHRLVTAGDAREVATIEKMLVETEADGRVTLRIRTCGRDPIDVVFPNPVAHDAFHQRALATTTVNPLISMDGRLGSYLLQELAIWVCGQVGEREFPHDVWVMTAVCEPNVLGGHQSTTILLIRQADLDVFRTWSRCEAIEVEHGSHGQRILTLMKVAEEFDRQLTAIERRRAEGRPANFEETMYILDLGLDTRSAPLPTKPVPWERFSIKTTAAIKG